MKYVVIVWYANPDTGIEKVIGPLSSDIAGTLANGYIAKQRKAVAISLSDPKGF